MHRRVPLRALIWAAAAVLLAGVHTASAHATGAEPAVPPSLVDGWTFDPLAVVLLAVTAAAYLMAVRHVNAAHPTNHVPIRRTAAWVAGIVALAVALLSPIDGYATSLFSIHMVQHLLLTMVAAPLLVFGAPITLLLRTVRPEARRRFVLPVLHSRPVRVLAFPVVSWGVFATVMWVSHFSPLFNAALDQVLVHQAEHLLFLVSAALFWWPVIGADPAPWRLPHAARLGYVILGMPQNAFLGLAIYSATSVLYPHYATLARSWGPSALEDQQIAGGIMWVGGDLLFLIPVVGLIFAWFAAEEASTALTDARLDRERAAARRGDVRP